MNDQDLNDIAKERLIEIYAEYLTEMAKEPTARDKKKILEIGKEVRQIESDYGLDASDQDIVDAAQKISNEQQEQLQRDAEAKAKADADEKAKADAEAKAADAEKAAKEREFLKKYELQYYRCRNAQRDGDKIALSAAVKTLEELEKELKNVYGRTDDEIDVIKQKIEVNYRKIFAKRNAVETYNADIDKRIVESSEKHAHKIKSYKKTGILSTGTWSKIISNAIAAAGMIGALLTISSASAVMPVLPVMGVVSFIASAGQRRFLTGIRTRRLNTLKTYYNDVLGKQHAKLNKYSKAAEDYEKATGNKSIKLERKITKQEKKMGATSHKINKLEKKANPYLRDIVAAGLEIGISFLLATCCGTLAPQIIIGAALFGVTTLGNFVSKKMGG